MPPIPPTERGRGSKFLERAVTEVGDQYVDIVGDEIKKFLANQPSIAATPGGGRPPMLVKKGTSSGGATKPVVIYHEPEPPSGSRDDEIGETFTSLSGRMPARGTGAASLGNSHGHD